MVASGIFVTMRTPRSSVSAAPLVVCFSDVDGTLMDERERLIIDRDDAAGFASFMELVLTSSRTLVELARIQRRLGLVAPLIGENGAVVGLPPRWRGGRSPGLRRVGGRSMQVIPLGQPAVTVRSRTRRCARAASVRIVEQRDLLPDRGRSLRRTHSVCVRNWRGPAAERFLAALRDEGLDATRSGRWITITAGADKGGGAREVLAMAVRRGAQFQWSAAIGNAENDAPLLAAADRRYAIRNPRRGHDPALVRVPRVHALTLVGLAGWREALGRILAQRRSQ